MFCFTNSLLQDWGGIDNGNRSCLLGKGKHICPPVNKHSNGKSPSWIGNTSSNGGFSIAMLDYRSVQTTNFSPTFAVLMDGIDAWRFRGLCIYCIFFECPVVWSCDISKVSDFTQSPTISRPLIPPGLMLGRCRTSRGIFSLQILLRCKFMRIRITWYENVRCWK